MLPGILTLSPQNKQALNFACCPAPGAMGIGAWSAVGQGWCLLQGKHHAVSQPQLTFNHCEH